MEAGQRGARSVEDRPGGSPPDRVSAPMEPHVPHVGRAGTGLRLRAGLALTVEPMINLGGPEVRVLDDDWTVVTADGRLSAQFEHTVVVTKGGCEVVTRA